MPEAAPGMRRVLLLAAVLVALALGAWLAWDAEAPDGSEPEVVEGGGARADAPALEGRGESALSVVDPREALDGRERVHGFVRTTAGDPAADIPVQLLTVREEPWVENTAAGWLRAAFGHISWDVETERLATTTSAADGGFAFEGLRCGVDYVVRALPPAPWFPAESWSGANPGTYTNPTVLVIGRGSPLRLRVVNASGRGLRAWIQGSMRNARTAEATERLASWTSRAAQTTADGRLHLPGVPHGRLVLRVAVPRLGSRDDVRIDAPREGEVLIQFGDPNGATVHGRVHDTNGGAIKGARVLAAVNEEGADVGWTSIGAVTGTDGIYRIAGLPPGELEQLMVVAPGFVFVENAAPVLGLEAGETARVDVRLSRGGVLEGVVTGPDGAGIAEARVVAVPLDADGETLPDTYRAVSGPDGHYRLESVPTGRGLVSACARGLYLAAGTEGQRYQVPQEGQTVQVPLHLRCGVAVRGLVVDPAGAPVPGARITVRGGGDPICEAEGDRERFTDDDGRFVFEGLWPSERWRLRGRTAHGFAGPLRLPLAAGDEPKAVRLVLHEGATITGRVAIPGQPAGVRPRVHCRPGTGGSRTQTIADDDRFAFRGVPAGPVTLYVVSSRGQRTGDEVSLEVEWGQRVEGIVLRSARLGEVAGHVRDEAGRPAASVLVLVSAADETGRSHTASARTGPDGYFHFRAMSDLEYEVFVGGTKQAQTARVGDRDLRLVHRHVERERLTIEGTVSGPDGRLVHYAEVEVIRHTGKDTTRHVTDTRRGHFRRTLLGGADRFDVHIRNPRGEDGRRLNLLPGTLRDVDISAGPVHIRLEEGLVIEGHLEGPPPEALGGMTVSLCRVTASDRPARGARRKEVTVEADGVFRFIALGAHAFRVWTPGSPEWIPVERWLHVRAGQRDVVVRMQRTAPLAGRILTADGTPAAYCFVHFYWTQSDGERKGADATTTEDGRFELSGVPADVRGTLRALHRKASNRPLLGWAREEVVAGATAVELRLQPGVLITGQVIAAEGKATGRPYLRVWPVDAPLYGLHSHAYGKADGSFSVGPMPPGRYRLQALNPRGHPISDVVELDAPAAGVRLDITPR